MVPITLHKKPLHLFIIKIFNVFEFLLFYRVVKIFIIEYYVCIMYIIYNYSIFLNTIM